MRIIFDEEGDLLIEILGALGILLVIACFVGATGFLTNFVTAVLLAGC